MPHDEDEPPPPLSPAERARLFDLPEKRDAPPPPPMTHAPREEPLELDLDRPRAHEAAVVERIRVGGPAVLVRVFLFSASLAFLLYQALRHVYRH